MYVYNLDELFNARFTIDRMPLIHSIINLNIDENKNYVFFVSNFRVQGKTPGVRSNFASKISTLKSKLVDI